MQKKKIAKKGAIIFDLGGVLIDLDENKLIQEFRNSSLSSISANRKGGWDKECSLYETGKINTNQFIELSIRRYNLNLTPTQFKRGWNTIIIGESCGAVECLKNLRHKYLIYIASNTNPLHFNFIKYNFSIFNYIDRYTLSYKVSLLKPDPEFFIKAQEDMLGGKPPFLYIDDSKENVEAATKVGWRSIYMHSMENFEGIIEMLEGIDGHG
jgi:putative hydrolase of the HAD superfamily